MPAATSVLAVCQLSVDSSQLPPTLAVLSLVTAAKACACVLRFSKGYSQIPLKYSAFVSTCSTRHSRCTRSIINDAQQQHLTRQIFVTTRPSQVELLVGWLVEGNQSGTLWHPHTTSMQAERHALCWQSRQHCVHLQAALAALCGWDRVRTCCLLTTRLLTLYQG